MKDITIPHFKTLRLRHVVCDYNGTLAKDGILIPEAGEMLKSLCETCNVHVVTSDTFGIVKEQLEGFDVTIRVLESDNHTLEKAAYLDELVAKHCVAIGNGNNDSMMLKDAALGIAIMGDEGCAMSAVMNAEILCRSITDALGLLMNEKRMIATLRK